MKYLLAMLTAGIFGGLLGTSKDTQFPRWRFWALIAVFNLYALVYIYVPW